MSLHRESGLPVAEAMRLLLQALQNEAETFVKLISIYTQGGAGWLKVEKTIEQVYNEQEQTRHEARPRQESTPWKNNADLTRFMDDDSPTG